MNDIVERTENDFKSEVFYFYMYEIYTEYMIIPKLEDLFHTIKMKQFGYFHSNFDKIQKCLLEEQDFIENPPVVEEGSSNAENVKVNEPFLSTNKRGRAMKR